MCLVVSALLSASAAPALAQAPLAYHQGPVLTRPSTTYIIYWQGSSGTLPSGYVLGLQQFVSDWGNTPAHEVLTQYFQDTRSPQHVSDSVSYGGTALDTDPFQTKHNILTEAQIQATVLSVLRSHRWPEGYRANYLVILPREERTRRNGACAWHDWAADHRSGGKAFYAVIPYWQQPSRGCPMPSGPYPHGRADIDDAIDLASHELSEIATDPWYVHSSVTQEGWYVGSNPVGDEIGDICRSVYGLRDPLTGADVFLHGHAYLIQGEWSNASGSCSLGSDIIHACGTVGSSAGSGDTDIRAYGVDCAVARQVVDAGAPGWTHTQNASFERWVNGRMWITGRPLGD